MSVDFDREKKLYQSYIAREITNGYLWRCPAAYAEEALDMAAKAVRRVRDMDHEKTANGGGSDDTVQRG